MLRCLILQCPSPNIHNMYMTTNLSDSTIEAELICANKRYAKPLLTWGAFVCFQRGDSSGSGTHASLENNLTGYKRSIFQGNGIIGSAGFRTICTLGLNKKGPHKSRH